MYNPNEIRMVHLELTSKCNAACPMCARNIHGAWDNPNLEMGELTLEEIKTIFDEDFLWDLNRIYLCGNYGDPMVAKDLIPILRYFREVNPDISLGMHTNGSGRTAQWWTELAELFQSPGSTLVFSIDGLADTNHLYRRRTRWTKIMESVKAFIGAGGHAGWEYLVFEHNQHQIEEARGLAAELGFKWFTVKKSGRFINRGKTGWVDGTPVYDTDGSLQYVVRPASEEGLKNQVYSDDEKQEREFHETIKAPIPYGTQHFDSSADFGEFGEYVRETPISCQAKAKREIFVDFKGRVFPCCWTGFPLYNWDKNGPNHQIKQRLENFGLDRLDARLHPIRDIIAGDLFQRDIPLSWVEGQSIAEGKLMICAQHCGLRSHVAGEYSNDRPG